MKNARKLVRRSDNRHSSSKLPRHARRHLKLPTMPRGQNQTCMHSLSKHEDIKDPRNRNTVTVSFAMPCISQHLLAGSKHSDAYNREWV
jgi:hypothetical protein